MRNTIQNLENLYSDYANKFDAATDCFKGYLSRFSIRCYYLPNHKGNTIKRYTIAHGYRGESDRMTRAEMIKALKNAIDNNQTILINEAK